MRRTLAAFLTLILLGLVGCQELPQKTPSISSVDAAKVLKNRCLDCHRDYQNFKDEDFIKRGLVVPGKPQSSFLYASLRNSDSGAEQTMPPKEAGDPLSPEEVLALKKWIEKIKVPEVKVVELETFSKGGDLLSEAEIFSRCYGQWLRSPLPRHHTLLKKIEEGKLSGVQACKVLLNKASLEKEAIVNSDEGRKLIQTFQSLHRSWFSELNLYNTDEQWGNFEIYDPGNLAAYFTYSLFHSKKDLASIFRGKTSYELIRKSDARREYFIFPYQETSAKPLKLKNFSFGSGEEKGEDVYPPWKIRPIPTGEIVGIRPAPKKRDILPTMVDTRKGQKEFHGQRVYHLNQDIRLGRGGGILGDPLFLLLNMKMEIGKASDGGKRIPRKWATSIFKDFMCRDLPVVPIPRAKKYIRKDSPLSFRQKASCVQCHMSMDGIAGLIRNFEVNYSVDSGLGRYIQTSHIRARKSTKTSATPILGDGDEKYSLEPARGLLAFQSRSGLYYEREVASLEELGDFIAESSDFYQCMSKRYLYFLTGINLDLDGKDLSSGHERVLWQFNQKLALRLQDHQSLRQLIEDIISSPLYRDRHYLQNMKNEKQREPAQYDEASY